MINWPEKLYYICSLDYYKRLLEVEVIMKDHKNNETHLSCSNFQDETSQVARKVVCWSS
ncbi:unnamed protein product [Amoebophrya sp. A25]|nr:unnamed protein product [Amoebophrya sp. A25]|eukprot:GSA25T00004825001.1